MDGDVRLLQDDWRSKKRRRRMDIVVEENDGSEWAVAATLTDLGSRAVGTEQHTAYSEDDERRGQAQSMWSGLPSRNA